MSARAWGVVLYLGLVATGVAYLLFTHALRHISGATGVTLALAEPVVAFCLAVAVVGESPSAMAVWGLAGVIGGLLIVVWSEIRGRRGQRPGDGCRFGCMDICAGGLQPRCAPAQ